MKNTHRLFLMLVVVAGMSVRSHAAGNAKASVIVMPVRYTVVQFAFDVARIRPVEMLAYDTGVGDEPLLLHKWDASTANWKPADIAAYQDESLFAAKPKRVFLVGSDADLPVELADASVWCKDVVRIPSLKVIDMANTMNKELKFSRREWSRLAKRHNLKLTDDNEELRRYGRYGKPGTTYQGERPVNPLIARFRQAKEAREKATESVEESIDVEEVTDEAVETDAAEGDVDVAEPSDVPTEETWAPAVVTETKQAVVTETPMAGEETEAPATLEDEAAAEDK